MIVFGGLHPVSRQISTVEECKLKRIGTLDFESKLSDPVGCAQRDNAEVFVCFAWDVDNLFRGCRRSVGPLEKFSKWTEPKYDHYGIPVAVTSGKLLFCRQK